MKFCVEARVWEGMETGSVLREPVRLEAGKKLSGAAVRQQSVRTLP